MTQARFIYDTPSKNADVFYYTHFLACDPVVFFMHRGKKFLVMSDLEIDRAKKESSVDEVLSLSFYHERAARKKQSVDLPDVLHEIFLDRGISRLEVPSTTGFALVDALRELGYEVSTPDGPFIKERFVKSVEERKLIEASQKVVFASIKHARDILKASNVKGNRIVYKGKTLTSEWLRAMIEVFLLERDFGAEQTIVASRPDAIDPHSIGHGPLRPNDSIIIDVFPRSLITRYYGDATRTFCKGRASDALNKMYDTVLKAQEMGLSLVKAGVVGHDVHAKIINFFEEQGYHTGERKGRQVGFFHGTGHSIGLDIHEEPARINRTTYKLCEGNVMSVEPGLYYPEIGGVRIEDLVYVTKTGCEVLAGFPKKLEIV